MCAVEGGQRPHSGVCVYLSCVQVRWGGSFTDEAERKEALAASGGVEHHMEAACSFFALAVSSSQKNAPIITIHRW